MPDVRTGAPVRYHGTLTDLHGLYLYDGLCGCDETGDFDEGCDEDYPNRHQLAYDEPPAPDGTRRVIVHVRRHHFTPVTDTRAAETPAEPERDR